MSSNNIENEPKYFQKRNEIKEIKKMLQNLHENNNTDYDEMQAVLKKIILFHTTGIDMSEVYEQILMVNLYIILTISFHMSMTIYARNKYILY